MHRPGIKLRSETRQTGPTWACHRWETTQSSGAVLSYKANTFSCINPSSRGRRTGAVATGTSLISPTALTTATI